MAEGPNNLGGASGPDPSSVNRRSFFRRLLFQGMDEVEKRTQDIGQRIGQAFGDPEMLTPPVEPAAPAAETIPGYTPPDSASPIPGTEAYSGSSAYGVTRYLRPPGAQPGSLYRDYCSRCAACVTACPVQAIVMDPTEYDGLPHIVARRSPCVVCADISCSKSCPSGALLPLNDKAEIRMGFARVDSSRCLRSYTGEDCRLCVSQCPIGAGALTIDSMNVVDVRGDCTGCGVCERACPTDPPAIWVEPNS